MSYLRFAFQAPVVAFPSVVLKLSPSLPVSSFLSVWKLFLLQDPLPGKQVPIPKHFVLFFLCLSFAISHSEEIGLPLWKSGVLCQHSVYVLWSCSKCRCIFWGEGDFPILFPYHLESPPWKTTLSENV